MLLGGQLRYRRGWGVEALQLMDWTLNNIIN